MTGLKRSLKYWGYIVEEYFLMVLFVIAVYGIFFNLMSGNSAMDAVVEYIPIMFCVMILALAYNNMTVSMSQAISMGATRRESFIGMQVFYHLLVVQGTLITGIIITFVPDFYDNKKLDLILAIASIYLLACSLGNVIGVAMMKFGLNIAKIIYILALVASCLGVLFVVLLIDLDVAISTVRISSLFIIGFAVVLDMVMVRLFNKAVREYEVRV